MKRRHSHVGRCPKTGKRSYRESLDVLLANANNPRRITPYRCECGAWHGTTVKSKARAA